MHKGHFSPYHPNFWQPEWTVWPTWLTWKLYVDLHGFVPTPWEFIQPPGGLWLSDPGIATDSPSTMRYVFSGPAGQLQLIFFQDMLLGSPTARIDAIATAPPTFISTCSIIVGVYGQSPFNAWAGMTTIDLPTFIGGTQIFNIVRPTYAQGGSPWP